MKKTLFMAIFFILFANAHKLPNDMLEKLDITDFSYDIVLTFGNENLKVNDTSGDIRAGVDDKKKYIDNNKTYQKKLTQLKEKNENFCEIFYDDLKKFENIKIVEPTNKNVSYLDENFEKNMSSCYRMGMDWHFREAVRYDGTVFKPDIYSMKKPFLYSLYKLDESNLFLIQRIKNKLYVENNKFSKPTYSSIYALNIDICDKAISKEKEFRIVSDRKILGKTDYKYDIEDKDDDKIYFNVINYKDKIYTLNVFDDDISNIYVALKEYDFSERNTYDIGKMKCERRYYYTGYSKMFHKNDKK